jgi:hypothetical protein
MGDGRWAMGDGRWAMGDGRWDFAIVKFCENAMKLHGKVSAI